MSPQVIELKPNQALLDPKFDGYKLSLDQIPAVSKELPRKVHRISSGNYSFLHTKLYGLHNHLIGETINGNSSVYFVDQSWRVCKMYVDPFSNELIEPVVLWDIPQQKEKSSEDYNVSLKIVGKFTVLADGQGTLYVLDSGSREDDNKFKVLYFGEVINGKRFVVVDAVAEDSKINVLLMSIQTKKNGSSKTVLNWITLAKTDDVWGQVSLKEMQSCGEVQYAYLARNGKGVYVASEAGCTLTINSDFPVGRNVEDKLYSWCQDDEEINVAVPIKALDEGLLDVQMEGGFIKLTYDGNTLLEGHFYGRVYSNQGSWIVNGCVVEITLVKEEVGEEWPELVVGDRAGELLTRREVNDKVQRGFEAEPQNSSVYNNLLLEDCDLGSNKTFIFERIDGQTNEASHLIALGSHEVLLTTNLADASSSAPALGIRHDVDVCLWQPKEDDNTFKMIHEGTLLAFGYVQASKQQRKFSVCSSDLSYSVICETSTHLFVYRQKKSVESGQLRNRTCGRSIPCIAQQQVVKLTKSEVLGIYSTPQNLFILYEDTLSCLSI